MKKPMKPEKRIVNPNELTKVVVFGMPARSRRSRSRSESPFSFDASRGSAEQDSVGRSGDEADSDDDADEEGRDPLKHWEEVFKELLDVDDSRRGEGGGRHREQPTQEEGAAADSDQVLTSESTVKRSVEEKEEAATESNARRRRGPPPTATKCSGRSQPPSAASSRRTRRPLRRGEGGGRDREQPSQEVEATAEGEMETVGGGDDANCHSIVVATRLRNGALSEHESSQKLLAIEGQVENMVNQFWSRTESLANEYAALQDAHVQGEALLAAQASTQQGVQLLAEHQHATSLQFQQDLHDTRATLETHLNTLARMQAENDARIELAVKDRLEALTLQTQQEMSRIRVMVDEMKRAQTERQAAVNRALDALVEQVTAIAEKEREKEGNVERRVREVYESLSGECYNKIVKKTCDVVETRLAASEKR
ncbi:hypothetical protein PR002_g7329 [Phytophthora rubi]|uniref:Uncharacterized protein n=1 Tax=Phytophthora rubi TaxID=129364 RepID=A0A6A3N2X2_9STRA|nr:hypothetical protein PR002_g7329 [Phytophthora rubi]